MAHQIKLYNTATRTIEGFVPMHGKDVHIYSCGPTVYHYTHLGNLRAYVFADTLRRMFVDAGFTVKHVINITDVGHLVGDGNEGEDKMEKGAAREGKTAWDVAKFYTDAFFADLHALNIPTKAYLFPRATDYIQEQIDLIKTLEQKGYTYTISDGVYFDTSKFLHYGDFAKLDVEGLQSGARVEFNAEKKHVTDFALWKFSPKEGLWNALTGKKMKRDMEWDSPWGKGFPGWHIECSAMSKALLGTHFDIHTGGIDHIPLHHTNEIAQSECANGERYVNYWMHVNFLNDKDGKMAKSSGDFLRLESLSKDGISPLGYKYYLLTVHYRTQIEVSIEAIVAAQKSYNKLYDWCANYKGPHGIVSAYYKDLFDAAIHDDIGTPQAIALAWTMLKDEKISEEDRYATLMAFDAVLGLELEHASPRVVDIPDDVLALIKERVQAKEAKDWGKADGLRIEVEKRGFIIKDLPNGEFKIEK